MTVYDIAAVFTARKRSLGQGNIFTPVRHSVHRGGSTWPGTPPGTRQVHPLQTRYTPQTRYPPDQVPPGPGRYTPPGPGRYIPLDQVHPPPNQAGTPPPQPGTPGTRQVHPPPGPGRYTPPPGPGRYTPSEADSSIR